MWVSGFFCLISEPLVFPCNWIVPAFSFWFLSSPLLFCLRFPPWVTVLCDSHRPFLFVPSPMSYYDKELTCRDCGAGFTFTAGQQEFFASKGFENGQPPDRSLLPCVNCSFFLIAYTPFPRQWLTPAIVYPARIFCIIVLVRRFLIFFHWVFFPFHITINFCGIPFHSISSMASQYVFTFWFITITVHLMMP